MPERSLATRVTGRTEPDPECLWPGPNDVLFVKNVPYEPTLGVGDTGPGWFEYIESYRDAGRALVDIAIAGDHERMAMPHLAGIPVLFLYRHYLELVMKELLLEGARHLGEPLTPGDLARRYGHNLLRLWRACQDTVDAIWPGANDRSREGLTALTRQIEEFAAIDPGSFAARYPMTRDDAESLPAEQFESFDLSVLADGVERIGDIISGVGVGIYELDNAAHTPVSSTAAE